MNAAFFDTNIIVYAADSANERRIKRAQAFNLMVTRTVTTSTQVVMELYGVLQRKFAYGADAAMEWLRALRQDEVIALSPNDVMQAIQAARRHDISHWDGLIIATERAGTDLLYTEDLNHGQSYGKVRACNPFIEDFLA